MQFNSLTEHKIILPNHFIIFAKKNKITLSVSELCILLTSFNKSCILLVIHIKIFLELQPPPVTNFGVTNFGVTNFGLSNRHFQLQPTACPSKTLRQVSLPQKEFHY